MAYDPTSDGGGGPAYRTVTPPAHPEAQQDGRRSTSQQDQGQPLQSVTPPISSHLNADGATASHLLSTPTTTRIKASKDLPNTDRIENATVEELRSMVKTLVNDLTDARINVSNARLQHHLLLMETSQAAERAEVEKQLSLRQVDFLRVKQNKPDSTNRYAVQPPNNTNEVLSQNIKDLEDHCASLEELCDQLKREKELQAERIQSLSEHNTLLVNRIRENREHFTRIRARSPIFATPRETFTTPRRRGYLRYQDDTPAHGPFAALIAADQILSQETASVPSTPSKLHTSRVKYGHIRGAHSLSSIKTSSNNQERPSTSDGFLGSQLLLSAPSSQVAIESAERERHDRDSTISISDDNAGRDELTQSQASSLATDMLRRNPNIYESLRGSQDAEKSSSLLQSKIFGSVKKSAGGNTESAKLKRAYGYTESSPRTKKLRTEGKIGLGIEA